MEKITELLDKLENLGELIPKLDTLTGWVQWLVSLAVRVGPVCMLVLGLIYLLIPPKEANHKAGYRTYFGMGSIMAWRFTQRVAGIIMTIVGLLLTIVAYGTVAKFASMDLMEMGYAAFQVIKVQVILALIIFVAMFVLTVVVFDRKGYCRFPDLPNSKIGQWLFREESALYTFIKAKKAAKQPVETIEQEQQQSSSVDAYIIEDL